MFRAIVTTTIVSRHDAQRFIQFPMELDGVSSVAEAYRILTERGAIYGQRVNFTFLPDNRRQVTERIPQIVSLAGIATLAPCPYEYFETDEVGANA